MARLIDADAFLKELNERPVDYIDPGCDFYYFEETIESVLNATPTVDAVEVVRGWWKCYTHSALVRWKDGEPVWEDRNVYRCGRCDFGTIAKHNYCPRCGAKMMDGDWNG